MREKGRILRGLFWENKWKCFLFAGLDLLCFWIVWLIDDKKAEALVMLILLFTAVLLTGFFVGLYGEYWRKKEYLESLLEEGEIWEKHLDAKMLSSHEIYLLQELGKKLRDSQSREKQLETEKKDQSEYIETWVHEMKTPVALCTLILDNRRDEMSREVYQRMRHVNGKLQEYAEQILYYSRLHCEHKDYLFQRISLQECVESVVEDYGYFLEEKQTKVDLKLGDIEVYIDRKGLEFMLAQILSNSITYLPASALEKEIVFEAEEKEKEIILSVRDNGIGVKPSDLPFVFEKGFSGDNQEVNKKTTGMGLYLVREMAESLMLTCEARSEYGEGFQVDIRFPVVRER